MENKNIDNIHKEQPTSAPLSEATHPAAPSNTKALLSLLVIIAAAVALYFLLHKPKPAAAPVASTPAVTQPVVSSLDWTTKIPEIQAALANGLGAEGIEVNETPTIISQTDLTGDGVPEAFVDAGSAGASSDNVALLQMVDGQVVLMQLKNSDGTTAPAVFVEGAASTHNEHVAINASKESVAQTEIIYGGGTGSLDTCTDDVYTWDPSAKLFAYNATLSAEQQAAYCATVPKTLQY